MLAHDADIPIPYSSQQPIPFVRNPISTNVIGGGSFRREGCLSGLVAMAPLQPRTPLGYPPEPSGRLERVGSGGRVQGRIHCTLSFNNNGEL
jgi:hypothetical protein